MKKLMFVMALAISMVALSVQCKNPYNKQRRNTEEKTVPVPTFDKIKIMSNVKVNYTQGAKHSVKIIAAQKDLDKVKVKVKDNTLQIYAETSKKHIGGVSFCTATLYHQVVVNVTSPQLSGVKCDGVGDFVAMTDIKSPASLDFSINGSGDISLKNVTADNVSLGIAGSGDISVQQVKAKKLTAGVAGSGDIDIDKVDEPCSKALFSIAGSGDIDAMFSGCDMLECLLAGSGDIKVSGHVTDFKSHVKGSGSVYRNGLEVSGNRTEINNRSSSQKKQQSVNNINAQP